MALTEERITAERIDEAVEMCDLRVGEVWGEMFPEATTGDFPPDAAHALKRAIEDALRTWLVYNTDLLGDGWGSSN